MFKVFNEPLFDRRYIPDFIGDFVEKFRDKISRNTLGEVDWLKTKETCFCVVWIVVDTNQINTRNLSLSLIEFSHLDPAYTTFDD